MSEAPATSYDPGARRDTLLARQLIERIRRDGPMDIADFVDACLLDRDHGYYVRKPAVGASGDFITAPEISQVFGELLGAWCAVVWQQMSKPRRVVVVELGPGRGTMMADMLRTVSKVPALLESLEVLLVERNETLQAMQADRLRDAPCGVRWVPSWEDAAEPMREAGCAIVVGNEFLDATTSVRQFERVDGDWRPRLVDVDAAGRLIFATGGPGTLEPSERNRLEAAYVEARDGNIATEAGTIDFRSLRGVKSAASLFIDYGHIEPGLGDTLQAVRDHGYEHPLKSPGEADLTTHVDFAAVGRAAASAGLAVEGSVTQAEFLGRLGIAERASRLMSANPMRAAEIESAIARLMAPQGMGTRFKAIGVRSPNLPTLPGFADG